MPQKRVAITNEQKRAVRAYCNGNPRQHKYREVCEWFQEQYGRPIAQSSISEILSSRYTDLDDPSPSKTARGSKRRRTEHWPQLEAALYEWMLCMEGRTPITGDVLREKAAFFFQRIPMYQGVEVPAFSNGWLMGFKARHQGVKQSSKHSEAGQVQRNFVVQDIGRIQQLLAAYNHNDIFSCEETGLLWRMIPDRGLYTQPIGREKQKARITAHLCCNATGAEKLPIWLVGTAAEPAAFRAAKVNTRAMDLEWRHNASASMTSELFEEWLLWFDMRMTGRNVILLMASSSVHQLGVSQVEAVHTRLKNTLVIWLPASSTNEHQPMKQGIIQTWKAYYRKQWLQHILQAIEARQDPLKTMNVLKAIRWGRQAWTLDVQPSTIHSCFVKSQVLGNNPDCVDGRALDRNAEQELQSSIHALQMAQYIHDAMDAQQFVNVEEAEQNVEERIAAQFAPDAETESDVEVEVLERVSLDQALQALSDLRLFEEQSHDGSPEFIQQLDLHERVLLARKFNGHQQQNIAPFFQ